MKPPPPPPALLVIFWAEKCVAVRTDVWVYLIFRHCFGGIARTWTLGRSATIATLFHLRSVPPFRRPILSLTSLMNFFTFFISLKQTHSTITTITITHRHHEPFIPCTPTHAHHPLCLSQCFVIIAVVVCRRLRLSALGTIFPLSSPHHTHTFFRNFTRTHITPT